MAGMIPTRGKGRATRELVVDAATCPMADRGAARTGLGDMHARSGVCKSRLFHHLDDDGLVGAVTDRTIGAVLGSQPAPAAAPGGLRPGAAAATRAPATLASVPGELVLPRTRRDPRRLRIALDATLGHVRVAAASTGPAAPAGLG